MAGRPTPAIPWAPPPTSRPTPHGRLWVTEDRNGTLLLVSPN